MCTMIALQAKIQGRGKNGQDWFELREAKLIQTIEAVLAQADERGVLEDKHQAASR